MKRRTVSSTPQIRGPIADKTTIIFVDFPALMDHCTSQSYDDGSARRPGWFTVQASHASWIVIVKDPDSATQLRCEADTLDDALSMAELLLSDENTGWMPDPWLEKSKRKK